jgi:hypothetical protein
MKYTDLNIQTQREFPNNARTQGFGWLVRAGYLTRENDLLPLGEQAIGHLQKASENADFISLLSLGQLPLTMRFFSRSKRVTSKSHTANHADTPNGWNWRSSKRLPCPAKRNFHSKKFSRPNVTPLKRWRIF